MLNAGELVAFLKLDISQYEKNAHRATSLGTETVAKIDRARLPRFQAKP